MSTKKVAIASATVIGLGIAGFAAYSYLNKNNKNDKSPVKS
jgi:hypothetical protein